MSDHEVAQLGQSVAERRDLKMGETFTADTAEHSMELLRDDGLYRHVRFARPGTSIYLYDLVTWPGNLVICGDIEAMHFSRIPDMFDFFVPSNYDERWPINPHYWEQKLQGRRAQAQEFSETAYVQRVREWADQQAEEMDPDEVADFRVAVHDRLLRDPEDDWGDGTVTSLNRAYELMREFEHKGVYIYDPFDWELRDYTTAFLWNCWAIVRGIQRYRSATPLEQSVRSGEEE